MWEGVKKGEKKARWVDVRGRVWGAK